MSFNFRCQSASIIYANQDKYSVESYTFLCPLISDVSLPALFMPTKMNDIFLCPLISDVSLPALFMPTKMNAVFNPRAHQYFHPTGKLSIRFLFLCPWPERSARGI